MALGLASPAGAEPRDPRFGAVDAFFDSARADELGVAWSRVLFPWQRVQRTGPHEWWPAIIDDYLNEEVRRGRELVGVLVNTPDWAATSTARAYTSPPRNLDRPVDDPENDWAAYVRRTTSAYRGRVDTWIVWNEPDVWDPQHPGYTWSGTVEEFYRLQKVAYRAARLGNPEAKVLLPGLTYWWDRRADTPQYFERLLDVASRDPEAPANGWFFDAAVLQLYNEPELLYEVPRQYRAAMAARGIAKPIWVNETNVAPWDDFERPLTREHWRANAGEQASYAIQGYALALAAGVDRISVYKLKDEAEWRYGWEAYGTIRYDRTQRPFFTALQLVHRLYAGMTGGTVQGVEGVQAVTLRKPGTRVVVLWSREPRAARVQLAAVASEATVYGRDGVARTLAAQSGRYALELGPSTHNTAPGHPERYLTGGPPLIVVEQGAGVDAALTAEMLGGPEDPRGALGPLQRAVEALREVNAAARR
ncbi:MAG TPA: hypothetical protein VGM69_01095 [Chloroflexota bacterium]